MPVTEHPNIEVFKQVYDTFTTGDMGRLAELIAKDVVWHVPGTNLISGEYTSREAIFGGFSKIFELSKGTYRAELHDILADDEHTVALLHATARHGEKDARPELRFHLPHPRWPDRRVAGSPD